MWHDDTLRSRVTLTGFFVDVLLYQHTIAGLGGVLGLYTDLSGNRFTLALLVLLCSHPAALLALCGQLSDCLTTLTLPRGADKPLRMPRRARRRASYCIG